MNEERMEARKKQRNKERKERETKKQRKKLIEEAFMMNFADTQPRKGKKKIDSDSTMVLSSEARVGGQLPQGIRRFTRVVLCMKLSFSLGRMTSRCDWKCDL